MKNLVTLNKELGFINRVLALSMCSILLVGTLSAQGRIKTAKPNTNEPTSAEVAPSPIFFFENVHCKDLNRLEISAFSHITTDWELKLDFAPPMGVSGPYPFVTGGGVVLGGNAVPDPLNSVSVVRTGVFLDWSSTRFISAVIVKGGNASSVYPYNPPSKGGIPNGIGLTTFAGTNNYSHVTFCFEEEPIGPSASTVSLAGRVIATNGRGISGVNISSVNAATGEVRNARTNSFGYYRIDELVVGDIYVVSASSKRHQFFEGQRTISLDDNLEGYDFVAVD